MTRVLITGGTGFIGAQCLARLIAEDVEVHAVNRSGAGPGEHVTWHARDLRDAAQAASIVAEVRPTHLLHCAWIATPGVYGSSPENIEWLSSGVAMAVAFGAHGGRRFLGVGTSAEYDPGKGPCREDDTPIRPTTIYGKCKASLWFAVQAASQHCSFSAAWGRLFLPYGPGDSCRRLIPSVVSSLHAGKVVRTTQGLQERDFIFAPDAGDLLVRLLLSRETGAFNIGTGEATTVRSVVERLATARGRMDLVQFGAVQPSPLDPAVLVADMSKVRDRLGWSAAVSIRAGLDQVLASADFSS